MEKVRANRAEGGTVGAESQGSGVQVDPDGEVAVPASAGAGVGLQWAISKTMWHSVTFGTLILEGL